MDQQSIQFRSAHPGDLPALNHISFASKRHWGYPEEWMERWRDDLQLSEEQLQTQEVMVAIVDGQAAGFCTIAEEAGYYEIMHLFVSPVFIGRGLGKQLLQQALEAFTQGDKPIRVESDPNAEAFYQRQGFETFDQIESYPPGRFLPLMRKTVVPG